MDYALSCFCTFYLHFVPFFWEYKNFLFLSNQALTRFHPDETGWNFYMKGWNRMKQDEIFIWKDEIGWNRMKFLYERMKPDEIFIWAGWNIFLISHINQKSSKINRISSGWNFYMKGWNRMKPDEIFVWKDETGWNFCMKGWNGWNRVHALLSNVQLKHLSYTLGCHLNETERSFFYIQYFYFLSDLVWWKYVENRSGIEIVELSLWDFLYSWEFYEYFTTFLQKSIF